jgi:hypothetical protein
MRGVRYKNVIGAQLTAVYVCECVFREGWSLADGRKEGSAVVNT